MDPLADELARLDPQPGLFLDLADGGVFGLLARQARRPG